MALTLAIIVAPSTASAQALIGRVPLSGALAGDPSPPNAVGSSGFAPAVGPPGEPYFAQLTGPARGRSIAIASLDFSAQPIQFAFDARRVSQGAVVYSRCPVSGERGVPICQLYQQDLRGPARETVVTATPPEASDRLPSAYAGDVAFARFTPGRDVARVLLQRSAAPAPAVLRGGPRGTGEASPTGIALRGSSVAYVWRWRPRSGVTRFTLQLQRLGQPLRTIASMDSGDGRILGPVWKGPQLLFAIRSDGRSRFFSYDQTTRRFASAVGPRNLAAFAISGPRLYWQTARAADLRRGDCSGGCPLLSGSLPRLSRSGSPG